MDTEPLSLSLKLELNVGSIAILILEKIKSLWDLFFHVIHNGGMIRIDGMELRE